MATACLAMPPRGGPAALPAVAALLPAPASGGGTSVASRLAARCGKPVVLSWSVAEGPDAAGATSAGASQPLIEVGGCFVCLWSGRSKVGFHSTAPLWVVKVQKWCPKSGQGC
jgi:hypothetical protein